MIAHCLLFLHKNYYYLSTNDKQNSWNCNEKKNHDTHDVEVRKC